MVLRLHRENQDEYLCSSACMVTSATIARRAHLESENKHWPAGQKEEGPPALDILELIAVNIPIAS